MAYDHRQFMDFARNNNINKRSVRYIMSANDIRGLPRGMTFVGLFDYWKNENHYEIMEQITVREITIVPPNVYYNKA